MSPRLISATGWVVLVAWAISFILSAVVTDYEPPSSLHALMVIVAGSAFGANVARATVDSLKKGNGNGH